MSRLARRVAHLEQRSPSRTFALEAIVVADDRQFEPTREQRNVVEEMRGMGGSEDEIAECLNVAPATLRRYFRSELDAGPSRSKARVRRVGYAMAVSGRHPAMTRFFLQLMCGLRETLESTDVRGAPMTLDMAFAELKRKRRLIP